jgi:hypothetical protein
LHVRYGVEDGSVDFDGCVCVEDAHAAYPAVGGAFKFDGIVARLCSSRTLYRQWSLRQSRIMLG